MLKRSLIALLSALALIVGGLGAGSAQAVTWTNLGLISDTTYVDNCDGTTGSIRIELEWQLSSDYKLRLNKNRDIKIVNNSKVRLDIYAGGPSVQGSVTMVRLAGNPSYIAITTYGNEFSVFGYSTKTLSVDNPDRWVRMDRVEDSDPSPYGNAIATSSDPAMEISAPLYAVGGRCGTFYTEIVNNAA